MRNRTFHRATIGGVAFEGILSGDGPYLSCQTDGGVALGVSGLRQYQPATETRRHVRPFGWWVVKYRDEERIGLPGFSPAAIRQLSDEFGLVILAEKNPCPSDQARQLYFFTSPAWDALRQWVIQYPRLAKALATCDPYLPGWYARAVTEAEALSA